MNVEDAFDIQIPDDDAQSITTVGELYDYVIAKTTIAPAGTCPTESAFYDLGAGAESCGITERFGPSAQLDEIFPKSNRLSFWAQLSKSIELELPRLVRPSWVITTNFLVTIVASAFVAYVAMGNEMTEITFPLTGIICLFLFGFLTTILTEPFATNFDSTFVTFRGLSERVLALNSKKLKNQNGLMGRNDIWVVLRELIVDALGVDHDEVSRNANFVKDLGCG